MSDKPVIVYGASGYTGRLICEYLREYNVPFVAAGRDTGKLDASMGSNVAGIETAQYDVAEVSHDVEALTELFKGASVVCNTVGPFSRFGPEVVEACLAAGVHYTDTTGEQDWLITCDERYGADFAAAGLLLSPGIAQMYTTGEIAAQLCLDQAGSRHPGHRRSSGVAARPSRPPRRSCSTPHCRGALSRAERVRAVRPGGRSLPARHPGPARARARPSLGRDVATRCGSGRTRVWPTSRLSAGCSTRP